MSRRAVSMLVLLGALIAVGVSAAAGPAVTINYRQSSCLQLPNLDTGQVRFFIQLVNSSTRKAAFAKDIRFLWLRSDGWKDSWQNTIDGGSLTVLPKRGKRYYADWGSDPTKRILRCALRIGDDERLHHVKVLV